MQPLGPLVGRYVEGDHDDVGGLGAAEQVTARGRAVGEECGRAPGGRGDDDGIERLATDVPPAVSSRSIRSTGAEVRMLPPAPVIASAVAATSWASPPRGAAKIGPDAAVPVPLPPRRARRQQEAALARREFVQLWHLAEAEPVGVGGVDAADERIDEPFLHLVAEPGADEPPDRVGVDRRPGEERFERGAGLAPPGEQPGRGERSEMPGHAEQEAVGDPVQRVVPDRGVHRLGRHQLVGEADLRRQLRRVRDPGEEGVGTAVDHVQPGEGRPADPAAGPLGRLEHRDVERCGAGELPRRGEPGDPAADHGDPAVLHRLAVIDWPATSITRSASAAITSGSALMLAVRSKARPARSARCAASMSRSYSTSR